MENFKLFGEVMSTEDTNYEERLNEEINALSNSLSEILDEDGKAKWSNHVNEAYNNNYLMNKNKIPVEADLLKKLNDGEKVERIIEIINERFPYADLSHKSDILSDTLLYSSFIKNKENQQNNKEENDKVLKSFMYDDIGKRAFEERFKIYTEYSSLPDYDFEARKKVDPKTEKNTISAITTAMASLSSKLGLSNEEIKEISYNIDHEVYSAEISESIREKISSIENINGVVLDCLSEIHNNLIKNNSDEESISINETNKKLYLYAPIELIGWNNVKENIEYIKPILNKVSFPFPIDEEEISKEYHGRVEEFMTKENINNEEDLKESIRRENLSYPVVDENISYIVTELIDNWKENDPESYNIFSEKGKGGKGI